MSWWQRLGGGSISHSAASSARNHFEGWEELIVHQLNARCEMRNDFSIVYRCEAYGDHAAILKTSLP